MSSSKHPFDHELRQYVVEHYPVDTTILDVGAGRGHMAQLLPEYFRMDGIEIFEPLIEEYQLKKIYRKIICDDVCGFDFAIHPYDLVVLGDVLEHLEVAQAQAVLDRIHENAGSVVIAVPYKLPQEAIDGNPYEIHLQPDLTSDLMLERYKDLQRVHSNDDYGVFASLPHLRDTVATRIQVRVAARRREIETAVTLASRNYDESIRRLQDLCSMDQDDPMALIALAEVFEQHGDAKRAAARFTKALECAPMDKNITLKVVHFLRRHGMEEEAEELVRNFLEYNPGCEEMRGELP